MVDLMIITNRRFETAAVNAESDAGLTWLNEHMVSVQDGTITVSLEGAVDIERDATKAGLKVGTR